MGLKKLEKPADLEELRKDARAAQERYRARVLICMTGCRSLGAIELGKAFREEIRQATVDAVLTELAQLAKG